jgi:hypothetical protein
MSPAPQDRRLPERQVRNAVEYGTRRARLRRPKEVRMWNVERRIKN